METKKVEAKLRPFPILYILMFVVAIEILYARTLKFYSATEVAVYIFLCLIPIVLLVKVNYTKFYFRPALEIDNQGISFLDGAYSVRKHKFLNFCDWKQMGNFHIAVQRSEGLAVKDKFLIWFESTGEDFLNKGEFYKKQNAVRTNRYDVNSVEIIEVFRFYAKLHNIKEII